MGFVMKIAFGKVSNINSHCELCSGNTRQSFKLNHVRIPDRSENYTRRHIGGRALGETNVGALATV